MEGSAPRWTPRQLDDSLRAVTVNIDGRGELPGQEYFQLLLISCVGGG